MFNLSSEFCWCQLRYYVVKRITTVIGHCCYDAVLMLFLWLPLLRHCRFQAGERYERLNRSWIRQMLLNQELQICIVISLSEIPVCDGNNHRDVVVVFGWNRFVHSSFGSCFRTLVFNQHFQPPLQIFALLKKSAIILNLAAPAGTLHGNLT